MIHILRETSVISHEGVVAQCHMGVTVNATVVGSIRNKKGNKLLFINIFISSLW